MASINVITGVADVLKNLRARNALMAAAVERALKRGGLQLQRASQKKVPIEFGVLKNSAFTRATGKGYGTVVTVGYTASYAIFVHENVEMAWRGRPRISGKGKYWDPQGIGQSKFLEEPARTMRGDLRKMLTDALHV